MKRQELLDQRERTLADRERSLRERESAFQKWSEERIQAIAQHERTTAATKTTPSTVMTPSRCRPAVSSSEHFDKENRGEFVAPTGTLSHRKLPSLQSPASFMEMSPEPLSTPFRRISSSNAVSRQSPLRSRTTTLSLPVAAANSSPLSSRAEELASRLQSIRVVEI